MPPRPQSSAATTAADDDPVLRALNALEAAPPDTRELTADEHAAMAEALADPRFVSGAEIAARIEERRQREG